MGNRETVRGTNRPLLAGDVVIGMRDACALASVTMRHMKERLDHER